MSNREKETQNKYSIEEILAEAKCLRNNEEPQEQKSRDICANTEKQTKEEKGEGRGKFNGKTYAELIGEEETPFKKEQEPSVQPLVHPQPSVPAPEQPLVPMPAPEISNPVMPEVPQQQNPIPGSGVRFEQENFENEEEPPKRRGLSRLFHRRKKKEKYDEEEDIYYGMQLKPIEEYKNGYETQYYQEDPHPTSTFSYLFDETNENDVGSEIAARFEELHKERQKRIQNEIEKEKQEGTIYDLYQKPAGENTDTELFSYSLKNVAAQTKKVLETEYINQKSEQEENTTEDENHSAIAELFQKQNVKAKQEKLPVEVKKVAEKVEKLPVEVNKPINQQESTPAKVEKSAIKEEKLPVEVKKPAIQEDKLPVEVKNKIEQPIAETKGDSSQLKQPSEHEKEKPVAQAEENSNNDTDQLLISNTALNYLPRKKPIHIIELGNFEAVLQSEAQGYTADFEPKAEEPELKEEKYPVQVKLVTQSAENVETDTNNKEVSKDTEKNKKKSIHLHKFKLSGAEEDNDPQDELNNMHENELEDYSNPDDAPSISHDLASGLGELALRLIVTGICTLLVLILGFVGENYQLFPFAMPIKLTSTAYLTLNLSFLVLAMSFSVITIGNGLKALVKLQANSDSSVAVACTAVLVQSVFAFFVPTPIMHGVAHLYTSLAVGALFLNTAGKFSMVKRISSNFRFVASPDNKKSIEIFDDYNTSLQMAKGCVMDTPVIAYQAKTKFLKKFLYYSYQPDPSETASQIIAPISFISSLILCIACLFISKDATTAITAFAASACVCTPVTNMLSVNLPITRLCKLARKCGAMVVGYPAVEKFCETNAVMMDAKDLFPKGTIILNGIKTFGGQRIDEAIVDATALMCAVGGPLSDLFDQIINNRREMLPKVENLVYEDERGVMGWVSGKRILVGTRDLMADHGIEPPSRDYEEKYLIGGKQVVYLSSGGDLVALFILSYNSDRRRALELQRMEKNGISLIVRTSDPNITPEFLSRCFGIDAHSVRVLPERLGSIYQKISNEEESKASAMVATKGRPTAMMRILTACVRQKGNISLAVAMQNVAIILGFVLVAFLACYSGLRQVSTAALLVYEIFWVFVILVIPKLRKP